MTTALNLSFAVGASFWSLPNRVPAMKGWHLAEKKQLTPFVFTPGGAPWAHELLPEKLPITDL
jgi:hypothetical protein